MKGVRKGCSLSPTLFKFYKVGLVKKWKMIAIKCIRVNAATIVNALLYGDDQAIVPDSDVSLRHWIGCVHLVSMQQSTIYRIPSVSQEGMAFKGKALVRS